MKMFVDVPPVYLHKGAVDFRKSVNGLSLIVEQEMELSSLTGALFVFCNKRRDKVKILYWHKNGYCLWYKRLEQDKFHWPGKWKDEVVTLSEQQLHWLLSGYDITRLKGHETLEFTDVC